MAINVLAEVPSSSDPNKTYRVTYDQEAQSYGCTCMDFLTRRRFKGEHCKHIKEVIKSFEQAEAS